jgi:hypothetical protein
MILCQEEGKQGVQKGVLILSLGVERNINRGVHAIGYPDGGFVIVWRWVIAAVVVIGLPLGVYLNWFAETSSVRITIDNQSSEKILVYVFIDGEDFGHQRDLRWVNFSDRVDFDGSYPLTRGSHLVLVKTIVPELEYRFTVKVGVFDSKTTSLKLTETSLELA